MVASFLMLQSPAPKNMSNWDTHWRWSKKEGTGQRELFEESLYSQPNILNAAQNSKLLYPIIVKSRQPSFLDGYFSNPGLQYVKSQQQR